MSMPANSRSILRAGFLGRGVGAPSLLRTDSGGPDVTQSFRLRRSMKPSARSLRVHGNYFDFHRLPFMKHFARHPLRLTPPSVDPYPVLDQTHRSRTIQFFLFVVRAAHHAVELVISRPAGVWIPSFRQRAVRKPARLIASIRRSPGATSWSSLSLCNDGPRVLGPPYYHTPRLPCRPGDTEAAQTV
jgi:hypothetical protein